MRGLAVALLLVTACARPEPTILRPTPTPEPGVLEVTALLDLSSARGVRGDPQRNALQLWSDLYASRGGGQLRIRTKHVDVGTSEARLLIELRRAVEEDRADAVIVGVPIDADRFAPAAAVAALPIFLTLPAPEPVRLARGGRWMFSVAPTPEEIARRVVDPIIPRRNVAVLARDDRALDAETAAVVAEYARRTGEDPLILKPDPKREDQLQTVLRTAASARRVRLAGPVRDWGWLAPSLLRSARAPTYELSYTTDPAELAELRELDVVWPAPQFASTTGRAFARSYADRHGPPPAAAAAAYDVMSALVLAAERVGTDDRGRLRDQVEQTAFAGAGGAYSFAPDRHAGGGTDELAMYRWIGGAAVVDLRR